MKELCLDDIKELNRYGNIVIVRKGKVYDLTKFAQIHPGGLKTIETRCDGRDVAAIMASPASHRHSQAAYQILDKYCIGTLQKFEKNSHEDNVVEEETLEINRKIENLIDWDKPLLCQVGQLGSAYQRWLATPVDYNMRLFHSDFVETFSGCPWWVVPIVWIPITFIFLLLSFQQLKMDSVHWFGISWHGYHLPFLFALGVLLWTLLEYVIHRWLFHRNPPESSPWLITAHFLLHGMHHKCPFDKLRLVFPPVPASVLAVMIITLYRSLFPPALAWGLLSGTTMGYISYDMVHYYLHHGTPAIAYFRRLKKYHVQHHFIHTEKGFGISSKLWDIILGTLIPDK